MKAINVSGVGFRSRYKFFYRISIYLSTAEKNEVFNRIFSGIFQKGPCCIYIRINCIKRVFQEGFMISSGCSMDYNIYPFWQIKRFSYILDYELYIWMIKQM